VDGGAVEAEEDAVGNGCPGGVLGAAVEAHLHITARPWPCEVDLGEGERERRIAAVTLFSGLALRRRKTAFLSVKASKAMAAALLCLARGARGGLPISLLRLARGVCWGSAGEGRRAEIWAGGRR
jgi:hypothetical protein